jgi:integrase/recombinase XerD
MTTEAITPLRQRMIEDMSSGKLCVHTQRSHIYSCKRFAAFLKRSPETATCEDLRRFQLHLAETGMSICNRNRIMTGVRFLFRVTLRRLVPRLFASRDRVLPRSSNSRALRQLLRLWPRTIRFPRGLRSLS